MQIGRFYALSKAHGHNLAQISDARPALGGHQDSFTPGGVQ